MLCGVSFTTLICFHRSHFFNRGLFHLSGGTWRIFLSFLCTVFIFFCSYNYKSPWWQGSNIYYFYSVTLANIAEVRFARWWSSKPNHWVLELTLAVWLPAVANEGGTPRFPSRLFFFIWGLFTFLNEVLLECTRDADIIAIARKPSQSNPCLCASFYLYCTSNRRGKYDKIIMGN